MNTATAHACGPQRRRRDIFVANHALEFKPRQGRHSPPACAPMPLLRSWNHFGGIFYRYAAPLVLPKLCAATLPEGGT